MYTWSLLKTVCWKTGLRARLFLEDGTCIEGCGFGSIGIRSGEVVFSTSMTGYTEALTDPSYAGQILVWTHPMVGCYGVPSRDHTLFGIPSSYESDRIHVEGFIVSSLPPHNHYLSVASLDEWLKESGVPGMYGVDTRALVKKLREQGVMRGVLAVFSEKEPVEWDELAHVLKTAEKYELMDFTHRVSPRYVITHKPLSRSKATIAILDCGVKYGILRWLLRSGFEVIRFPCSSAPQDLIDHGDGIVISNGPGNPAILRRQIRTVREIVYSGKPVLGICLGMQLIALALGANVYKLKYGHRGPNKGVLDALEKRAYITTQNHGFAVEEKSLADTELILWFKNIDDGSVEGYIHRKLPVVGVQFHPEGGPGPWDTAFVFNMFEKMVINSGDA